MRNYTRVERPEAGAATLLSLVKSLGEGGDADGGNNHVTSAFSAGGSSLLRHLVTKKVTRPGLANRGRSLW